MAAGVVNESGWSWVWRNFSCNEGGKRAETPAQGWKRKSRQKAGSIERPSPDGQLPSTNATLGPLDWSGHGADRFYFATSIVNVRVCLRGLPRVGSGQYSNGIADGRANRYGAEWGIAPSRGIPGRTSKAGGPGCFKRPPIWCKHRDPNMVWSALSTAYCDPSRPLGGRPPFQTETRTVGFGSRHLWQCHCACSIDFARELITPDHPPPVEPSGSFFTLEVPPPHLRSCGPPRSLLPRTR